MLDGLPSSRLLTTCVGASKCTLGGRDEPPYNCAATRFCLVPYIPPVVSLLENPLTLPSPFYFATVLPAHVDPLINFVLPANATPAPASTSH